MNHMEIFKTGAHKNFHLFTEVHQCGHCGKKEEELDQKLKRCVGCSVTMYCSRECQRSAWKSHKMLCRSSDRSERAQMTGQLGGYSAPIALDTALQEWDESHLYSIASITTATVHLQGGVDYNLTNDRAIMIRVSPKRNDGESRTPANAFQFVDAKMIPRSEIDFLAGDWDDSRKGADALVESLRRDLQDPTLAGSIPGVIVVVNTGFATFRRFLVYRRVAEDGPRLHPRWRALLEDILTMCIRAMNSGIVLRASDESNRDDPNAGRLVQRRKKWEWKAIDGWDWSMLPSGAPDRCGLDPAGIWKRFYAL